MVSVTTAATIFKICGLAARWSVYICYGTTFFIMTVLLGWIMNTPQKGNWRLIVLVLSMMTVCASYPTYVYFIGTKREFRAYSFKASSVTFVHWMFCYIYLKLAVEVKYLFNG